MQPRADRFPERTPDPGQTGRCDHAGRHVAGRQDQPHSAAAASCWTSTRAGAYWAQTDPDLWERLLVTALESGGDDGTRTRGLRRDSAAGIGFTTT